MLFVAVRVGLLEYFTDRNFKLDIKTKKIQDPCALSFSEHKRVFSVFKNIRKHINIKKIFLI